MIITFNSEISLSMSGKFSFSDAALLPLIAAGDHSAFAVLYERHWTLLYSHCLRMLKDEEEAKDVVQELFISFWAKAAELDVHTNVPGYLYTAARHRVLNVLRKRQNGDDLINRFALFAEQHSGNVLDQITEKELSLEIDREIQQLPPKMREVFEFSRREHLTHRQIGDKLGISDQTVKKQVANAIKILRLKLASPIVLAIILLPYLL